MSRRPLVERVVTPAIPILRWFFSLFFDPTVMSGIYVDGSLVGLGTLGRAFWRQKVLGFNRSSPWPIAVNSRVSDYTRLHMHPEDVVRNLSSPGCYYQNFDADIRIGRGSYVAPNVGIITSNHVPGELASHSAGREVILGEDCWIGMNAVILPGVELGPKTIVGAGSVVTRSFLQGNCIIAGSPARVIRSF